MNEGTADLAVTSAAVTGQMRSTVAYWHDQFPSYELYVNGKPAVRNAAVVNDEAYGLLTGPTKVQLKTELQPLRVIRSSGG